MAGHARRYTLYNYIFMPKLKLTLISILIIALVAIAGYFTFNSIQNKASNIGGITKNQKVRIGYFAATASLGVFIAQDKGYFKDLGLDVELIEFQSNNLATDAIVRGDIEANCCGGIIAPLEANSISGSKLKLYTVSNEVKKSPWNQLIVKSDSTASNVKDLDGKKIGVFPGNFATPLFKEYLKQNKVDLAKTELIQLPIADQLTSLENGRIDALFAVEPTISIAQEKQSIKVIASPIYANQHPNTSTASGSIATKFINENPDQAKKFVQAMDKAHKYMFGNPAEAASFQVKYTKIDPKIAAKAAYPDYYQNTELNIETIQSYTDFLANIGAMKQKVVVKDLVYKI